VFVCSRVCVPVCLYTVEENGMGTATTSECAHSYGCVSCVVVCCSVLQWVAVGCSELQWVAVSCSGLQCVHSYGCVSCRSLSFCASLSSSFSPSLSLLHGLSVCYCACVRSHVSGMFSVAVFNSVSVAISVSASVAHRLTFVYTRVYMHSLSLLPDIFLDSSAFLYR